MDSCYQGPLIFLTALLRYNWCTKSSYVCAIQRVWTSANTHSHGNRQSHDHRDRANTFQNFLVMCFCLLRYLLDCDYFLGIVSVQCARRADIMFSSSREGCFQGHQLSGCIWIQVQVLRFFWAIEMIHSETTLCSKAVYFQVSLPCFSGAAFQNPNPEYGFTGSLPLADSGLPLLPPMAILRSSPHCSLVGQAPWREEPP